MLQQIHKRRLQLRTAIGRKSVAEGRTSRHTSRSTGSSRELSQQNRSHCIFLCTRYNHRTQKGHNKRRMLLRTAVGRTSIAKKKGGRKVAPRTSSGWTSTTRILNSFDVLQTDLNEGTSESSTHNFLANCTQTPVGDKVLGRDSLGTPITVAYSRHRGKRTPKQGKQQHDECTPHASTHASTHAHARGTLTQKHAARGSWKGLLTAIVVACSASITRSRQTPPFTPHPDSVCLVTHTPHFTQHHVTSAVPDAFEQQRMTPPRSLQGARAAQSQALHFLSARPLCSIDHLLLGTHSRDPHHRSCQVKSSV